MEEQEKIEKTIKEKEAFAKANGFKLNPNIKLVNAIIKGLLENEKKYGAQYCPCRKVSGNKEEDKKLICPCYWHSQEIEKDGRCHCGLFVRG